MKRVEEVKKIKEREKRGRQRGRVGEKQDRVRGWENEEDTFRAPDSKVAPARIANRTNSLILGHENVDSVAKHTVHRTV